MATIITLQSTDLITNSRADINTSLANLNSDKMETSVLDTDTALTANSDSKIPSQKAVKAYVDAGGNVNASETTKGIVEEATDAEVTAGTATGGTGAKLFVSPTKLASSRYSPTKSVTAGETINGATLPVPVYQETSAGKYLACDGDVTTKLAFQGFAISNSTDTNPITLQHTGIVSGFTGLTIGLKYYLSDTVGTISSSVGTYEVLVGIAISTTEILIQKGRRYASGVATFTSTSDQAITLGFRPSMVTIWAVADGGAVTNHSFGGWTTYGGNLFVESGDDNGSGEMIGNGTTAWQTDRLSGAVNQSRGVIGSITDSGFTLDVTYSAGTTIIYWTAVGEM